MRYTVSKSKEFEVLRKHLEDTKLQLDRALVFARGIPQDLEVGKVAPCDAKTAYQQAIRAGQLAAERYRDVLDMLNTLVLPDRIPDKTER
jgi:hypothetical protein